MTLRRATSVIAAIMLLAAASAAAKVLLRHYAGRTAQGDAVRVLVGGRDVGFHVSFVQSCSSPAHKPLTVRTSGTFGFDRSLGLQTDRKGRFKLRYQQGHTRVKGVKQYFTALYTLGGRVGKHSSSGTFRAVSTYYTTAHRKLGICDTGQVAWSARRT